MTPISCHVHDYFEAFCVKRYRISVTLLTNQTFEGVALDLVIENKQEYLIIHTDNQKRKVELTQISKVKVLSPNPMISELELAKT